MPYHVEKIKRIQELLNEIENRKEHENAPMTYKDVHALQELDMIVKNEMETIEDCDHETLVDSIFIIRYLASAYESMWRIKYANHYYLQLMKLHVVLYKRFQIFDQEVADDYYRALRARNYYGKDLCLDLVALGKDLIPEKKRINIEEQILEDYHPLKHDPIELTDAYLAVIDEVEHRMDTIENKNIHPFIWNQRFQALLKEYGIQWEPITTLNPGWHFD